jgi:TRAP-type mannitol/chloroaromatic compound transport system permease small subunit
MPYLCFTILFLLFIALFIIYGLLPWISIDTSWALQEWSNRTRGITNSERTPEWENSQRLAGALLMVMFIFLACAALGGLNNV